MYKIIYIERKTNEDNSNPKSELHAVLVELFKTHHSAREASRHNLAYAI
jgi:FMN-dependent NADH-azoreductase